MEITKTITKECIKVDKQKSGCARHIHFLFQRTPDGKPMYVMSGTGKVADVQYMYSSWYGNDEFKYQTYKYFWKFTN